MSRVCVCVCVVAMGDEREGGEGVARFVRALIDRSGGGGVIELFP